MSGKILFTTAVLLQLLAISPANAQMAQTDPTDGVQATQSTQAAQMNMRPGVRYTTGSYRISGWEDKLVTGNPNLGRWNWSAMVGYTQAQGSAHTGAQAIKVPLPDRRSHYVKPIHLALPQVQHTQDTSLAYRANSPASQSTDTKLAYRTNTPAPAPVMSYNQSYSGGSDRLIAHSTVSGALVHRGVSGSLIRSN